VKFEISPDAAAAVRQRGGHLWIWPSADRWPHCTTEPPGDSHRWTLYRQGELVVHVDETIVPPARWVVEEPKHQGRHLEARWSGNDPRQAFGRLPLVDVVEEEPEQTGLGLGLVHLYGFIVGALALLGLVGLHRWWFDDVRMAGLGVLAVAGLLVAAARRMRRRVRRV
jgi:hypothetical protein